MGLIGTMHTLCAAVGIGLAACSAVSAARFLARVYLLRVDVVQQFAKVAGPWAVVTGGSEGIGFAMASELAARGMHVIIVALDQPLLYDAAKALQAANPTVHIRAIPFDFLRCAVDDAAYDTLFSSIDAIGPVSILVNNVGGFYKYPKPFDAATVAEDLRLLMLNCVPQVRMTKHFLPRWKSVRCGAVLNLSSSSALGPTPYMSTYAATKAFNLALSESVGAELAAFNIRVLAVTPYIVSTRLTQMMDDKPMAPGEFGTVRADEMARHTIDKLGGWQCFPLGDTTRVFGHRFHEWMGVVCPLFGTWGAASFVALLRARYEAAVRQEAAAAEAAAAVQ